MSKNVESLQNFYVNSIPLSTIDRAKVKLAVGNLIDKRERSKSIGFKFDSLADVYKGNDEGLKKI